MLILLRFSPREGWELTLADPRNPRNVPSVFAASFFAFRLL